MNVNTQVCVIGALGVALILLIIMKYPSEIIIAIISGLIGYLTNNKVDTDKLHNTITSSIDENLNNTCSSDSLDGIEES